MKRSLYIGGAIGAAMLLGGSAPIVPSEMELLYSYQGPYAAQFIEDPVLPMEASTTLPAQGEKEEKRPIFDDDNGDGLISVSVFQGKGGQLAYIQIPESRYADMGRPKEEGKGIHSNPTKTEFLTVFEAMAEPAKAAIAFDAAAGAKDNGGVVTSLTYAHTVTGTDTILVVTAGSNTTSNPTVTGVTYNGVAMTEVRERQLTDTILSISYLIAPTTGANNVVVTWSAAGTGAGKQLNAISVSYTGAKQTGQPDSSADNTFSAATSLAVSTTVVAENSWLSGALQGRAGEMINGTGPETQRNVDQFNQVTIDTNGVVATGAQTLDWTWSTSDTGVGVVISIAPAGGAGGATFAPWQFNDF